MGTSGQALGGVGPPPENYAGDPTDVSIKAFTKSHDDSDILPLEETAALHQISSVPGDLTGRTGSRLP